MSDVDFSCQSVWCATLRERCNVCVCGRPVQLCMCPRVHWHPLQTG